MFRANGYNIIETKEEFLSDWNPKTQRWNYNAMPQEFDVNTATFPIALKYIEPWDSHCCGTYIIVPIKEAVSYILTEYDSMLKNITNKKKALERFFEKPIDKSHKM